MLFFTALFLSLFFSSADGYANENWSVRCSDEDDKQCEIFQRLIVEENQVRFGEIALQKHPEKEDGYQAVAILPLGLLIPAGITISVDGESLGRIVPQFCTEQGCVMTMDLTGDGVLDSLKKGEEWVFQFTAPTGQQLEANFTLIGFTSALRKLK